MSDLETTAVVDRRRLEESTCGLDINGVLSSPEN